MKLLAALSILSALGATQPIHDEANGEDGLEKRWGDRNGRVTWFDDGYGACGRSLQSNSQDFVAISQGLWNLLYQGNPNNAWMCQNHWLVVNYNGKLIRVKVEDLCVGCGFNDIDLSKHAFKQLAPLDKGVLNNVWWYWVD